MTPHLRLNHTSHTTASDITPCSYVLLRCILWCAWGVWHSDCRSRHALAEPLRRRGRVVLLPT